MKGRNTININQATMLEMANLWLKDQFKNAPIATKVSSGGKFQSEGFTIEIEQQTDPARNVAKAC